MERSFSRFSIFSRCPQKRSKQKNENNTVEKQAQPAW